MIGRDIDDIATPALGLHDRYHATTKQVDTFQIRANDPFIICQ